MRLSFKRHTHLPHIERLRLEPGDILVVKANRPLRREDMETIKEQLSQKIDGHEVLVISSELKLSVITPASRPVTA